MDSADVRLEIVRCGRSLFERGLSPGSSGNLSVRLADGSVLMTPTNVSLGDLDAGSLSELDAHGIHRSGPPPTKEAWLHLAMYRGRPQDRAIVHLHSTYGVALSCRSDLNPADMLPALTPYVVMRVGRTPVVPYSPPGSDEAAREIEALARDHRALLLANHGPVVSGPDIGAAMASAEELEQTARLFFLLEHQPHARLSADQVADLSRRFRL